MLGQTEVVTFLLRLTIIVLGSFLRKSAYKNVTFLNARAYRSCNVSMNTTPGDFNVSANWSCCVSIKIYLETWTQGHTEVVAPNVKTACSKGKGGQTVEWYGMVRHDLDAWWCGGGLGWAQLSVARSRDRLSACGTPGVNHVCAGLHFG